jgi:exonuclease SbcC
LDRWISDYDFEPLEDDLEMGQAIRTLIEKLTLEIDALQAQEQKRQELLERLQEAIRYAEELAQINREQARYEKRAAVLRSAEEKIASLRNDAKRLSQAALEGRTSIVGRVFNTSLNKVWRDLFVRLAPTEFFVPAFKLPAGGGKRAIEAQLHTVHRVDGTEGGPPGTMLSAGNLNTAALTLFLALHLSARKTLPWLILDDPVQSMDDVHISQFAALLRMISKRLQRQIVLAVHDRALFDYLMLELSPAFEGDRLITVELSRTGDGTAIATPTVLTYEKDTAIAA